MKTEIFSTESIFSRTGETFPKAGRLVSFFVPYKTGGKKLLVSMGVASLLHSKNVLHIAGESSVADICDLYDEMFQPYQWMFETVSLKALKTTSFSEICSQIDKLEQESSFKTDVLIIETPELSIAKEWGDKDSFYYSLKMLAHSKNILIYLTKQLPRIANECTLEDVRLHADTRLTQISDISVMVRRTS